MWLVSKQDAAGRRRRVHRYLCGAWATAVVRDLMPVGKPAPPRPRNPDVTTSSTVEAGPSDSARSRPRIPPCAAIGLIVTYVPTVTLRKPIHICYAQLPQF